jgi:4-amino-4-deoxy-L-arabinose transferase-like glycosyltransferase
MTDRRRDAWAVFAVALFVRCAVVAWARGRFPPTGDGYYYDVLAHRLAAGAGYTWPWPDGTVTYAAHYPVGFPALLAIAYVLFGPSDTIAMSAAALLGAASAYAAHRLVDDIDESRWRPTAAGLAVALHPALVPYTAARMTEGVTAALLILAAALASRARATRGWGLTFAVGVVMAVATLVRPQSLLLAPVLGALSLRAGAKLGTRVARAAAVTLIALACIAPWTVRNCVRMRRCALVSLNGGWNLLIGATTSSGGWEPISVPPACATVWDEAEKDACFERAAVQAIVQNPAAWLSLAPSKVSMTLDYFGAAPWYLNASNAAAFGPRSKEALAIVETVASRLLLLAALIACSGFEGPRRSARRFVALIGAAGALTLHGSIGYICLVACVSLLGRRALLRMPLVVPACAAVIVATIVVHSVFFGSGRYGLILAPFVAALAFVRGPAPWPPRGAPCA